ncbi:HAD family hydrolase [Nocardia sp. AB354]|uniref:HAD family hydrolase n=1 Tax=Nocardia sp. AB354 TaxID=3413283 RepID=UPI003C1BF8DF
MPDRISLPSTITACLFDLDGVLTRTATVHAAAWKQAFDPLLAQQIEPQRPFDAVADYDAYVDGRPREDGVRSFLASRGITLADGGPGDRPDARTVHVLAARKDAIFLCLLAEDGVHVYPESVRFVRAVRAAGLHRAVVSSSVHCAQILSAAGIADLFEVRIDGIVAARDHLDGKPQPGTYLAAARALGVRAADAAVFEDALAGMDAGRSGGFGFVVGIDRADQAEALRAHGADVVVTELSQLLEASA